MTLKLDKIIIKTSQKELLSNFLMQFLDLKAEKYQQGICLKSDIDILIIDDTCKKKKIYNDIIKFKVDSIEELEALHKAGQFVLYRLGPQHELGLNYSKQINRNKLGEKYFNIIDFDNRVWEFYTPL